MKKLFLLSTVLTGSLFALTNDEILDFYQKIVPQNVKAEIIKREKLDENPEFEAVILKFSDGQTSGEEIVFTKGDLVFNEILNLKTMKNYKQEISEKTIAAKLKNIYKNENSKYIISLGDDPKKPTQVMFSDPECPYCRSELKHIEQRLQVENLKIILTPVHDKSSLQKSYLIYKDVQNAKTDSEKVKIMRKYFDPDYVVDEKSVSEDNVKSMDALRQKYFNSGISSVPKFINEADLK